jgi:uncharacterized membrane protein YkvA (DUF1232 family)
LLATIKKWARNTGRDVVALWLAARDSRVPWHAKATAAAVAAYALSPIDLIPDFIPVLGYLDDMLILPRGILLAIKLIPGPIIVELRATAESIAARPISRAGMFAVVATWLLIAAVTAWIFLD